MSNIPRHSFSDIRLKHRIAQNTEAIDAMQVLAPYFAPEHLIAINLVKTWAEGGTFLSNWNLTTKEAIVAVETLKEIGCSVDCFFVVPIPSWKGFPEQDQQRIFNILEEHSGGTYHPADATSRPFPPYFSVHCTSPNFGCIKTFKELALVKLMEAAPSKELKTLERITEFHTSVLLSKYTLAGGKSE
jgi:hypothetical protein